MYVFELLQPGVWLDGLEDDQLRHDASGLLDLLTQCVQDAAITISWFEESQASMATARPTPAQWQLDREREREIEQQLEQQLPPDLDPLTAFRALEDIRQRAAQEAKRQKWREGHVPGGYSGRIPFIHAKTFLYALDTLGKALSRLEEVPGVPNQVAHVVAEFKAAFPDLIDVRDSAHHAEDRVQGKMRRSRIQPKPIESGAIYAPTGGVMILGMLNGNRYGETLGDGRYGEVEVSPLSVSLAQKCVQQVLDAFEWKGPAVQLPR